MGHTESEQEGQQENDWGSDSSQHDAVRFGFLFRIFFFAVSAPTFRSNRVSYQRSWIKGISERRADLRGDVIAKGCGEYDLTKGRRSFSTFFLKVESEQRRLFSVIENRQKTPTRLPLCVPLLHERRGVYDSPFVLSWVEKRWWCW